MKERVWIVIGFICVVIWFLFNWVSLIAISCVALFLYIIFSLYDLLTKKKIDNEIKNNKHKKKRK